ncbi:MAG: hypothetical protein L0Y36_01090 [Planctomycetales bacterium]|nr:hypothetical protein [Planctomycetales bacterium]
MTKTGRVAVYIGCFLLLLSVLLMITAVRTVRRTNQMLNQIELLMAGGVELGKQANAELWAAMEENNAIAAELAKPIDQRPADLEKRQTLNKQRIEGIQELLAEQQQIHEQIRAIQKQNGIETETESPETKAVLEKY